MKDDKFDLGGQLHVICCEMYETWSSWGRHFYENSVVDGCSDDERPPIDAFAWPQEGSVRVCFVDMQSCGDGERE